jgi:hypothetical protein
VKKGDPVLFAENSKESSVLEGKYGQLFYEVAGRELELYAIFYCGVGDSPPANVRSDLYRDLQRAVAAVFYFGSPKLGANGDWGLSHLQRALAQGIPCLVYVSPTFSIEVLRQAGFAEEPVVIDTHDEFRERLRANLQQMMSP